MRKEKKDLVDEYLHKGYTIANESKDYITLKAPKHEFSILAFVLWSIFTGGLGLIGYPVWHFSKSCKEVTIKK